MGLFVVILEGRGIRLKGDEPVIRGFYTTRKVRASNKSDAIVAAKNIVLAEWKTGSYAEANEGKLPELSVEEIFELNPIQALFNTASNKGYTFYSED